MSSYKPKGPSEGLFNIYSYKLKFPKIPAEDMEELDRCLTVVINKMVADGSLTPYFRDLPKKQVDRYWVDFRDRLAAKNIPFTSGLPGQSNGDDSKLSQMDPALPKPAAGRSAVVKLRPHPDDFTEEDLELAWQDLQFRLAAENSSVLPGNQRLEADPMINITIDDMDKLLSRGISSMINESHRHNEAHHHDDFDSSAPSEEEIDLLWQDLKDRVAAKVKKASQHNKEPEALDELTEIRMDQLLSQEIRGLVDEAGLIPSLPDLTAEDLDQALADFAARLDKQDIPAPGNWPASAAAAAAASAATVTGPKRLSKILTVIAAALILALALGAIGSFMPQEVTAWQKKFRAFFTGRNESSVVLKEIKPLEPGIYEMGSYEEINQYVPFVPIYPYDKLPAGFEEKMLKLEKTVEGQYRIEWLFAKEDGEYIQIEQGNIESNAWGMMLDEQIESQKLDLGNGKTCIVQKLENYNIYWLNEGKINVTTNIPDSFTIVSLLKQLPL